MKQHTAQVWIEISRSAFFYNTTQIKSVIGPDTFLGIVVKGNGYGHGLLQVAQLAQEDDAVDLICCISLSEALYLRTNGIIKSILVLSFIDDNPVRAIEHDIDLIVADRDTITWLSESAGTVGKRIGIHIKIDTGMSRLGFTPDEVMDVFAEIHRLACFTIKGISSHYAESEKTTSLFTQKQQKVFGDTVCQLQKSNITVGVCHIANSGAFVADVRLPHYSLVRIGAAVYGVLPQFGGRSLQPIATWKTTIAFTRIVTTGNSIGYARSYVAPRNMRIAILPVGYYNGYNQPLSNNGFVRVISKKTGVEYQVPIIGRVCMNHMFVDITDCIDVAVADEIILMGPYPGLEPWVLAQKTGIANARVMTTGLLALMDRKIVL